MGGISNQALKVIEDAAPIHDTEELRKFIARLEKAAEGVTGWTYMDLFDDYRALEKKLEKIRDMSMWTLTMTPLKLGEHIIAMGNVARDALEAERIK